MRDAELTPSALQPFVALISARVSAGVVVQHTTSLVVTLPAFRAWLAGRIDAYLCERGRGGLHRLAVLVGVGAPSINRWRAGTHNVARDHLPALLAAIGTSLADLSREMGVQEVIVPPVLARGATRHRVTSQPDPAP